MKKRYQYRTNQGVQWTSWFTCSNAEEKIQFKESRGNTLLNEYKH